MPRWQLPTLCDAFGDSFLTLSVITFAQRCQRTGSAPLVRTEQQMHFHALCWIAARNLVYLNPLSFFAERRPRFASWCVDWCVGCCAFYQMTRTLVGLAHSRRSVWCQLPRSKAPTGLPFSVWNGLVSVWNGLVSKVGCRCSEIRTVTGERGTGLNLPIGKFKVLYDLPRSARHCVHRM